MLPMSLASNFDDRPANDQRPTFQMQNFEWPYLRNRSSDSLHVWFLTSRVGFSWSADRMAVFPVGPNSVGM